MQAALTNPAIQDITSAASDVYQSVDVVTFRKDSLASSIDLLEFNLEGTFAAMDINVLASNAPIAGQLEKPDANTWIVRLPRALPLKRINVQELRFTQKVAAEPFIEAGYFDHLVAELQLSVGAAVVVQDRVKKVGAEVDTRLKSGNALTINAGSLDIYPVVGDKVMEQSIATVGNNGNISDLVLESFAIRARDAKGYSSLRLQSASHSISVYVDSQPQGLALGLVPVVNDQPQMEAYTQMSGFNLASNQAAVLLDNAGQIWRSAMQKYLDAHFEANESLSYKIGLVLRSENPCRFERTRFLSKYRLVFRNLQSAAGDTAAIENPHWKNYTGTQWEYETLQLQIPGNSILHSAVLPFKPTFNKNPFVFAGEPPPVDWLINAKGVELTPDQWAGGVFELLHAQSVRYLLVPIMATSENAVCALEIREDVNGQPAGAILTAQSLPITQVGRAAWAVIALKEPLKLYNKKLWWLLKTAQGTARQLVDESTDGEGITHFSLNESGGPGRVFRVTREQKVRPLFAKDMSTGAKLHGFLEQGESWLPLASINTTYNNLLQFDLMPYLTELTASEGGSVTLHLASLLKGKAEVHPAEIHYEIAPPAG